ncbi:MAG: TIGR01777 family oxidoreductase [Candidatus Krumholzibacteria bacterium]|nr:TIGR01777 family oxidoreductase [Candidatus Krumholzibacteria bacterium]
MRVFVTGGTGLVGRAVIPLFLDRGDEVLCLTRDPARAREVLPAGTEILGGDPTMPGDWQDRLATCSGVVNLAGSPVADGLWTGRRKQRIRRSRLATTENIVTALGACDQAMTLVSASAVGYYGNRGEIALDEASEPGSGFLARLALEWEHTALKAEREDVRIALIRIGVVLSGDGGVLARMLPVFRRGLGGPLGNGKQYFPWVHIEDLVRLILFVLDNSEISGPVNAVVPDPPRQKEFTAAVGSALHKRAFMPLPGFVLQGLMGEMSSMLLGSQRAVPNVLKAAGFKFKFGELDKALDDLI